MKNIFKHIISDNKKNAMTILNSGKISNGEIVATNLEVSASIKIKNSGEDFLAPLNVVQRCLNNKKNDIEFRDKQISVDGVTLTVDAGSEDVSNFPDTVPAGTIFETMSSNVSKAELQATLEGLKKAASTDETRRHINGVCFRGDYAAATNGHVLHTLHTFSMPGTLRNPVFVNTTEMNTLIEACKGSDSFSVSFADHEGYQMWDFSDVIVIRKYIENGREFPDVEEVFPKNETKMSFSVDGAKIRSLLKVMGLDGSSSTHCRVTVNQNGGEVTIESSVGMIDGSCAKASLSTSDAGSESVVFGVQGQYLIDATPKTGIAKISLSDPLDPILITHGKFKNVVMPTRLKEESE
jgi:DNA polymerase III sliding clamp (beta) subunit (PCNA family)